MKVLLFAYACCPKFGSEGGVGWKAATALAKRHRVHVITNAGWKPYIEEARAAGAVPEALTFHYIGRPPQWHPNRMIARLQSWNYYRRDMRDVLPLAARLHQREHFDLSHHVTYASWRIGSPLWRLPVPFIWGPVGGGESFPAELDATLSLKAKLMERLRRLSNSGRIPNGAARLAARRSSACIAANSETLHLLRRLRGSPDGTARLLQVFFTPLEIGRFTAPAARERPPAGPLRLFAGGNIEGGKDSASPSRRSPSRGSGPPASSFSTRWAGPGRNCPRSGRPPRGWAFPAASPFTRGFRAATIWSSSAAPMCTSCPACATAPEPR